MPIQSPFEPFPLCTFNDAAETIIYKTKRRLVSAVRTLALLHRNTLGGERRAQWVTAGKLRLLCVFGGELVSDVIEQLDVALLWVLLHRGNESPGHSACGLGGNRGISAMKHVSICMPRR